MFGTFDSFQFIFNRDRDEAPRLVDFLEDSGVVDSPEPGDSGDSTADPVFETSLPIEPEVRTIDTASFDVFAF